MNSQLKRPVVARPGPYAVEVEAGKEYHWCHCGLSKNQPWCDGAHVGSGWEPVSFIAPISAEFYMCGCKNSDNKPYCFGNCRGHQRLLNNSTAGET
jgi:CDGSH iron-sulfur domain-containing protein 3